MYRKPAPVAAPRPRPVGEVSVLSWGANPLHCFVRLTAGRLGMYLTQLGDLLNAGLTMHDAMGELAAHAYDWRLRRMSQEISQGAARGESLAQQLRRYPQLLPPHVRGMLLAGERAGALPQVCQELARELREQQAARWHAALGEIWFGLLFFVALLVPGLPRTIKPEGADWGAYLQYLRDVVVPVLVGAFVAWNGAKLIGSVPWLADPVQSLLYVLPGAGQLIRRSAQNRTCVSLEALLRAGVEIQEALALAADSSGNAVIRRQLLRASEVARQGRSMDEALKGVRFLPAMARQSLVMGERAGTYERVLEALAQDAKTGRTRTVWLVGIGGYGITLLLSAGLVVYVVYTAGVGYLQALLKFGE